MSAGGRKAWKISGDSKCEEEYREKGYEEPASAAMCRGIIPPLMAEKKSAGRN